MSCENKRHLLEVKGLEVAFAEQAAIRHLDVYVHEGEVVALVGASGGGKSLLAAAILGVLPATASFSGEIFYDEELLTAARLRNLRGREIAFVPQAVSFLDPLLKVRDNVCMGDKSTAAHERLKMLFDRYGLAEEVAELYPFELSGGMARRVLLACAMYQTPRLLIADEPTVGLDRPTAVAAVNQLREVADQGGGVLFITHDLELAIKVADRVAVLYDGVTIEEALAGDFQAEKYLRHPYTKALWQALPAQGMVALPVKPLRNVAEGCVFAAHCPYFDQSCTTDVPTRLVRCGTVRCVHAS